MNITVKIEATELADALNNLAVAMSDMLTARNESKAEKTAEAAVTKARKKKDSQPQVEENSGSDGSDQASAQVAAPEVAATTPAPTKSEAVTHDKAKTLAALKAKKVGPAVVRGVIADTGCAQISDITSQEVLVSLYANLEAL
jgi:hypothetical protein